MTLKTIKAAIFGGSGYGGSELIRLLMFHPDVEITTITANEHAGRSVGDVHRNLYGLTEAAFSAMPAAAALGKLDADVVFLALPHGQALDIVPHLPASTKVIDLSGDFRLNDPAEFLVFYGREHTQIELQKSFVYGLPELYRDAIRTAHYIANPGCFATAVQLALAPLVAGGLLTGKLVVDAKTGSSGSGAKPAANTHHPQRMNSFYAYKPFTHQHLPEIKQSLRSIGDVTDEIVFMTHSMPVSRGIFASCYAETTVNLTNEDLNNQIKFFYQDSYFVRVVPGSPDVNWVKTTNFCDLSAHSNGKQIAIFSAIDNLVKGAAGQAVQNMNLMFGLDERTGLIFGGTNP